MELENLTIRRCGYDFGTGLYRLGFDEVQVSGPCVLDGSSANGLKGRDLSHSLLRFA